MTLLQFNDGTPGSCDKNQAVFCLYGLVYARSCPVGTASCKPIEVTCKVPVSYRPEGATTASEGTNGTLSLSIDAKTGKLTSITLLAGQGLIPKSDGGTITPKVWKTPLTVRNFDEEKQLVTLGTAFEWVRKVDVSLVPALQGATTYLALVGIDGHSNAAAIIQPAPAYAPQDVSAWTSQCADAKSAQVKVTGTMKFAVSGLAKTHVEAAAKGAIAVSLDVSPKLVTVSATKEVSQARRLSVDSWEVSYEVIVPESKGEAVKEAAKAVSADQASFKTELVNSLESVAASTGTIFDRSSVTVTQFTAPAKVTAVTAKPTAKPGATSPPGEASPSTEQPTGSKPVAATFKPTTTTNRMAMQGGEIAVDSSTSLLLSSAVVVLVALAGSM